jgi:hypothetical protein
VADDIDLTWKYDLGVAPVLGKATGGIDRELTVRHSGTRAWECPYAYIAIAEDIQED